MDAIAPLPIAHHRLTAKQILLLNNWSITSRDSMELLSQKRRSSSTSFTAKEILNRLNESTVNLDLQEGTDSSTETLVEETGETSVGATGIVVARPKQADETGSIVSNAVFETSLLEQQASDSTLTLINEEEASEESPKVSLKSCLKNNLIVRSKQKRHVVFTLANNKYHDISTTQCTCVPTASYFLACKDHGRPFLISYLDYLY
ncbi:UNVERIFIED_CONTAM: hypothetical protein HDU68_000410 [Siphonaria sp. JEL0065]|nr:hypothetical protein HDU68_000410 [Siphonaria sp. JEL0065]